MNNYQIDELSQQYMKHSITISPYVMKKLGINRTKCIISTDEHQLACVPYTISLNDCRVLLILSPKEQEIITENTGQMMLHMEVFHPNLERAIPFFFRIKLIIFKQLNSSLNQCLLEAALMTIPQDYKEILVEYFLKDEFHKKCYKNPIINSQSFSVQKLLPNGFKKQAKIRFSNNLKMDCRIVELSLKKIIVFMDTEESILQKAPDEMIMEIQMKDVPVFLKSKLVDFTPSKEVEGYFLIILSLDFSTFLIDGLEDLLDMESIDDESVSDDETEDISEEKAEEKTAKNEEAEEVIEDSEDES